jgi:hypothetical protein
MGTDSQPAEPLAPQTVLKACHEIIDAIAAIVTNGEYVAERSGGESQQALAEIREAAERITRTARALQAECRATARDPRSLTLAAAAPKVYQEGEVVK